ncbi:MAG: LacI family DNA-binding transcriptional regulator [Chloroflexi bacterium]|nr:LacI family DNA-binding transcriptional regulator [Chloroflexota bacterium]
MSKSNSPNHVTLRDVAKLSGVSIKTVSRVVNNQGEISASTRQRIQAAIEQSGYRPNILARSLVNRRTDTLAVVAWGIDYFGPSRAVLGVEQQAAELGYSLLLNLIPEPDRTDVRPILDALTARRVDGIVWAVPEVGNNRTWVKSDWLAQLPPTVFLSMAARPGLSIIAADNRLGAVKATQHLIQQNRRTIGIINGPMHWWESRERFEGWKATCLEAGLAVNPGLISEGDWSARSGEEGMRKLLAQAPEMDAVFAGNDQMALGALGVIHSMGRCVPQDIAIVGFDDIPESAYFWPSLTTVNQHVVELGRTAVQTLHRLIEMQRNEQDSEPTTTSLAPELVIRQSSRAVSESLEKQSATP